MLVAGCSMLVEDPVFSGDKDFPFTVPGNIINLLYDPFRKIKKSEKTPYFIQYPETSIQHRVVSSSNHCRFQKLGSKFTLFAYEDS